MAGELDKSFLRLLPSFSDAKNEVMIESEFIYNAPICLHPNERYLQITNLPQIQGFASYNPTQIVTDFQNEVTADGGTFEAFDCLVELLNFETIVEIIDCAGNVLKDISDRVFFNFFNDINNTPQFAFEILPIQEDFYFKNCYVRISILDTILYSNGFYVTADEENKTFRLDYNNNGYYQGISYDKVDVYQSIRLFGYFNQPSTKEEVKIYTQLNGKVRRSRPIQGIEYKFNIDLIDTFTFERLSNALNSQIVYLNSVRFNTIDNVQSEERQGKSNLFSTSFKGQFDYKDKFIDSNQIASDFNITQFYPSGILNVSYTPDHSFAYFNYNIENIEYFNLYDFNTNELIENLSTNNVGNNYHESIIVTTLGIGKYYFNLKATSIFGEVLEITDKNTLNFEVRNADYSSTDYSNNYFI